MVNVVTFGRPVVQSARLTDAIVVRIADLRDGGAMVIVVCASPAVVADALAQRGYASMRLPDHFAVGSFDELARSGIPLLVGGGQEEAMALAATFESARVIVFADAHGVMSADPERVPTATPVEFASYMELMELADLRAGALPPVAAERARALGVPYEIRSIVENRGTIVRDDAFEERSKPVTSITISTGAAFVSVRPTHDDGDRWRRQRTQMVEQLAARGVSLEMLQFFPKRMRFTVDADRVDLAQDIAAELSLHSHATTHCAKVCVVGSGIRSTVGVFCKVFAALRERDITVLHFTDSNVTISLLLQEHEAAVAEQALHEAFVTGSTLPAAASILFDLKLRKLRVNGREVRLGVRQATLLKVLVDNVGRVVEAEEAARCLFGSDGKDELAALRVHMHNLRKKIEKDPANPRYILTIPNQGYLFVR